MAAWPIENLDMTLDEGDELGPWREVEPASWFYSVDGLSMAWTDEEGILHACKGAEIHPGERVIVTLCEDHDVPPNAAHKMVRG